jgi:hypothetical protein
VNCLVSIEPLTVKEANALGACVVRTNVGRKLGGLACTGNKPIPDAGTTLSVCS